MARLPEAARLEILRRRDHGETYDKIAIEMGISDKTARNIVKKRDEYGTIADLPRSGRPPILDERSLRRLKRIVNPIEILSLTDILKLAADAGIPPISRSTLHTVLHGIGRSARLPKVKPEIRPEVEAQRLEYAKAREHVSLDQWRRCLYTNETMVYRVSREHQGYMWAPTTMAASELPDVPLPRGGGGHVMISAVISVHGLHAVTKIEGNMTAARYVQTLQGGLVHVLEEYFPDGNAIFIQDNAPVHTAHQAVEWLSEQNCGRWRLPPYSPDLNPIENFWPMLKRAIRRYGRADSMAELKENIDKAVAEFQTPEGVAMVRKYIDSMPNRMQAVILKKGGATKY
jgi:transposase